MKTSKGKFNRNEVKWKIYVKSSTDQFFRLLNEGIPYNDANALAVEYSKIGYSTKVRADV